MGGKKKPAPKVNCKKCKRPLQQQYARSLCPICYALQYNHPITTEMIHDEQRFCAHHAYQHALDHIPEGLSLHDRIRFVRRAKIQLTRNDVPYHFDDEGVTHRRKQLDKLPPRPHLDGTSPAIDA